MEFRNIVLAVIFCFVAISTGAAVILNNSKLQIVEIKGIMPEFSEQELILNSDLIVEGIVKDIGNGKWSNPEMQPGKRNIIQTDITVEIGEILSGEYDKEEVVIRVNKGYNAESNILSVSDAYPDFIEGEHVLLFLARDDSDLVTDEDYFVVTGMKQGKWNTEEIKTKSNSDAGEIKITGNASGYTFSGKNTEYLKERIKQEKQNNPDWDEIQKQKRAQIETNNKILFGE